jgi:hypothetical protein
MIATKRVGIFSSAALPVGTIGRTEKRGGGEGGGGNGIDTLRNSQLSIGSSGLD